MSILIKGKDMPKGNSTLNVLIYSDGRVFTGHKNDDKCSAVEVLTPHGRLIDADTIQETHVIARDVYEGHNWLELCVTMDEIADMPTVIETEVWDD